VCVFVRACVHACVCVFYRPGWRTQTGVQRERRTSEPCWPRPNASLICARTLKRGTTYCAPLARLSDSPPDWPTYADSTSSFCFCLFIYLKGTVDRHVHCIGNVDVPDVVIQTIFHLKSLSSVHPFSLAFIDLKKHCCAKKGKNVNSNL
jgi:hypothetical protein